MQEKPGIEGFVSEITAQTIMNLVSQIPKSQAAVPNHPRQASQQAIQLAAKKASALSGTLSLPGGPLGLLSILPDLAGVWRIQAQLVSDLAAIHGKTPLLNPETMVWCLFKHSTAQLVRDLAVRTGQKVLIQKMSSVAFTQLLQRIGIASSQRFLGRWGARFLPLLGAVACGAYAWVDTRSVGRTALELFSEPQ